MKVCKPLALVAGVALMGTAWSTARPASSQPHPARVEKVVFAKDATEQRTMLDLGEPGFSPGDRVVHRATLYDATNTSAEVGWYRGDGVILSTDPGSFQTLFISHFPEGSITALGDADVAEAERGQTISIVGGTGAYRLARGTVTARRTAIDGERGSQFTFEVLTK